MNRSWIFRTVGYGHGPEFWRAFVSELRLAGYDGVISIEHEDSLAERERGVYEGGELPQRHGHLRAAGGGVVDVERQRSGSGLVGYGFMGRAHSNAYRQVGRFFDLKLPRMRAICGRDEARREGRRRHVLGWGEL